MEHRDRRRRERQLEGERQAYQQLFNELPAAPAGLRHAGLGAWPRERVAGRGREGAEGVDVDSAPLTP